MITEDIRAVDDGDFAVVFFDEVGDFVNNRGAAGTLEVGIFNNGDFCVGAAFYVLADTAGLGSVGDDFVYVVGGNICGV